MIVKAISIRQPWANLIASGRKTIETRLWSTRHRGRLLIVSSRRPGIAPAGCAVAIATLADCRPMTPGDEDAACCAAYAGAYAWILRDVRPIRPFAVKGMLRLFPVRILAHQLRRFEFEPEAGLFDRPAKTMK